MTARSARAVRAAGVAPAAGRRRPGSGPRAPASRPLGRGPGGPAMRFDSPLVPLSPSRSRTPGRRSRRGARARRPCSISRAASTPTSTTGPARPARHRGQRGARRRAASARISPTSPSPACARWACPPGTSAAICWTRAREEPERARRLPTAAALVGADAAPRLGLGLVPRPRLDRPRHDERLVPRTSTSRWRGEGTMTDVSPVKGVILGGGEHTVEVGVSVEEVAA